MHQHLRLSTLLALCAALGIARADIMVDSFEDTTAWSPNADGGNPPTLSVEASGFDGPCMRLRYTDVGSHWGNVRRALTVPPETTGLRLRLKTLSVDPGAAMHLWLFEADGDGYIARVRADGKDLGEWGDDWVEATVPFSAFRFDPRGNKKRAFLTIDHMLIGCNYADFEVLVDELRFVKDEVEPRPMPRTDELKINRRATGSVALLNEPTVERQPSHADPIRLARLLQTAGFGVTMLRAGDVCNAEVLTKANFDVLVLPNAPFFPAQGKAALRAYLKSGGAFFSTGGYAFDELVEFSSEGWAKTDPSVTAAQMDNQSAPEPGLNTRFGQHGDTMKLRPDQLGVFDPAYLFTNVASMRAAEGQFVAPAGWTAEASLEGFAATAMNGSNSPVFPEVYARVIPLIDAVDEFGRSRGAVGSLLHSFAGPYTGASWAFFGVTNEDLFDGRRPQFDALFVDTVKRLARPTFVHSLTTDLACYRQGERVTVSVRCQVPDDALNASRVHLEIDGLRVGTLDAPAAGETATLEWKPATFTKDLYEVRAQLEVDGRVVDEMLTGFAVWDEDVVRSGPSVALVDNYLQFRETPTFLAGTNQTGMMWYSANENPLVWDRDFRKMNDCGLNLMRILHFSPFARETDRTKWPFSPLDLRTQPLDTQRKTDAIVQLAQKHNVVVFLTLHDWTGVELTDEELNAQREWATFWASRYKDVPGIIYDIQNEPSVRPPDNELMRSLAEDWLAQRYGSVEEAQAAWRDAGSPTEIDFGEKPTGWGDLRARDLDEFRAHLFNRWTKANVDGAKAGDPDALLTVGFLQHATAADKLLGVEHVDFTNTHFYGRIPQFRRVLKMIDRRWEGKSFSLGEFGSREAHDARTHGKLGDFGEDAVPYYLAVGHYALGMGASSMANWDWKEMPGAVFPWGVNHRDLVSKPVLKAYRNMVLLFRLMQPRYVEPQVYLLAPDSHRFGPHTNELHNALMQSLDWMLDCNVPFGVIHEQALDRLPDAAKAIVWPLPYCPTDETFDRVREFVVSGGALCFTGDVRFSDRRKPDRNERLAELGLTADQDPSPPFAAASESLSQSPVWSEISKGRVCWVPRPLELDGGAPGADVYAAFLDEAGIARLNVTPSDADVQAFEVPLHNGTALIAYNDGDDSVLSTIEGAAMGTVSLALDPGRTGLVLVNGAGNVVATEGQGATFVRGHEISRSNGHQAVASLDGRDIRESAQLLVASVGPGEVSVQRREGAPVLRGEIGEFRGGEWQRLGAQPTESGTRIRLAVPPSSALDLRLLTAGGAQSAARDAAERLLLRE